MDTFVQLMRGGAGNLAAYLAALVSSGRIPTQAEIRQWMEA
jgi:hypothetical protein